MNETLEEAARKERPDYLSYLLRLWRASGKEGAAWRASLHCPHTGERLGFASLEELFDFLREQTDTPLDSKEDEGGSVESL
jgi:hypothetical protein